MHRPEDRNKLEKALAKHLGRTPAPGQLWDRVQHPRAAVARTSPVWLVWASAATAIVVGGASWIMWRSAEAPVAVESLAVKSLASGPEHLQFRSEEAAAVRNWLRENAGIDIPLPPLHSPLVKIVGASVIPGEAPVAEISYRVGEDSATLLVAKEPTGARTYPRHEVRASEEFGGARVSSWTMRGQSYTLAWAAPGEFRVACLLCHGGSEPPLLN
jgi:hypothetical protein